MAEKKFGIIAEFKTPAEILEAANRVRVEGFRDFDVHTPFPVHGLDTAMGVPPSKVPWIVLGGGVTGGSCGLLLQWWCSAVDYPLIIGGKPFFSYQAFVPITFELTILLASFGAVFGMLALNRLPMFYHPVFRSARFRRATDDRFFLSIEAKDPKFDLQRTRQFLEAIGGENVTVLEA
jgi:hypothetical protein